jgi:hypothetical protein
MEWMECKAGLVNYDIGRVCMYNLVTKINGVFIDSLIFYIISLSSLF